ncbi:glutamine amidotransferase-related protein [Microbacterium sp. AK031]|uniref:glutamine amidotransferase-related protein n=1 Tax=Microbacterium sp. AK031 TaxID=2723076 RepID=UPI0021695E85|nr:GMP synthase [Microbacterium sp. AK031]MCS3842946.1 GMP synthase (glutamine-hydrolyzing) [Microbacterium sp. AK031]
MASLLYVCVRPERGAAEAEHVSFQRGLAVQDLDQFDLLAGPLTDEVLARHDGFVIGGSPFNVTDAVKSPLQQRVEADLECIAARALDGHAAAFFTCFGIGVVTRMLGGTLTLSHPEATRATQIKTTDAAATDPVFGPSAPALSVFTAHKESAVAAPADAVLLATNDDCPVQAYRVGTGLYATQFHPEPSPRDFADRMTFYRGNGYFDPEAFDAVEAEILAAHGVGGEDLLRRFAENFA